TSSKPSKFAFASDEKSIRRPTASFARRCLYKMRSKMSCADFDNRAAYLMKSALEFPQGVAMRISQRYNELNPIKKIQGGCLT
ncbi:MAG: hypothetical protein Q4E18_11560, partial [Clostridia bacterium]|nr:hypothetical protein [Clostridia bacterium]